LFFCFFLFSREKKNVWRDTSGKNIDPLSFKGFRVSFIFLHAVRGTSLVLKRREPGILTENKQIFPVRSN
jgi:hypothetical protein